ncbi:uncharacterized protein LOC113536957 isoform X1 [Pangasianodon hypophthalmus]|uniref:uncharacterized protein LOC113536957 isoform X1 n=1 Tax=Pangasianodon hypophthalmus TaxID=310915 RepID=UPI002306F550|nr:uncharacterized protein LOC113536957 isoform X1 [Pangasianodon hypophthalmus]XP_053085126.1 uncharacterized protein LOC113536957 isoform X1 [Pangasianodon hypophthalmus]XP_053085127.1 uncharacterized protein LOC113536957 isoform X1 [Pangasianodon hypophthalmus]
MALSRGKGSLDSSSSISSGLEKCSLNAHAEANAVIVEKLEKENAKLKTQYEELRCQYVQLLEEAKEEKFDERRVNLLKAQVMQLERQVILLSEGLSSQVCRCQDVEKALDPLTQRLRSLLCSEDPAAGVVITRAELTQLTESCEDVKQKLHRNNKVTFPEDLAMPWMLSGSKLSKQPTTLLDLCYGKTNNLNLQEVSALESKLSQLFKHLHGMRQTLSLILAPHQEPDNPAEHTTPTAVYARLLNQSHHCCTVLDRCCLDLLTLSLIVPSAPWASPKQRVIQELEVENILATLPAFPRGAPLQRARRAAQALSRAANYSVLMAQQQVKALEAELDFHRSLYSLQVRTIEELIQGIRQAYQAFQENISRSLCVPLQDVLSCYEDLRSTASEAALHRFLSAFKSNLAQIREAVDAFGPSKSEGDEALAQYGHDFLHTVEKLLKECTENREKAASQLHSLQQEQQQAVQTLHVLRAQRKEVSTEKAQLQSACSGNAQCESPAAQSGSAEKSRTAPKEPSTTPAEQRNRVIRRALSVHASRNSSSQERGVNQRPGREEDGLKRRSSFRSKSRKTADRPDWQT